MLNCKYCNKECKNTNSLHNHERLCKLNPNRQMTYFQINNPQKINPWNKGLTANTDERIQKQALGVKKFYDTHPGTQLGRPRTEDERKKISEGMKKSKNCGGLRKGSGRGKKGIYKGFYCDSTYELAYIVYNLDHNIYFERCPKSIYYTYEYKNELHKYYPDFILQDGSLVEIKGYHTELVDIKINSVKDRNIKVLYEKDLEYAFNYVKETYKINKIEELYE